MDHEDKVTVERLQALSKKFKFKLIAHPGHPFQSQENKCLAFNKAKANENYSYALAFETEDEARIFVRENPDFNAFVEKTTIEYFPITD